MQTNQARAPFSLAIITAQLILPARDATNYWHPMVLPRNEGETQTRWLGDGHAGSETQGASARHVSEVARPHLMASG